MKYLAAFIFVIALAPETVAQGESFVNIEPANFDLAKATNSSGKSGYINWDKEIKISFRYDFVTSFSKQGFATVIMDGKYGIIDTLGNTVIPAIYEGAYSSDGAPVFIINQKGSFGVLNIKKEQVIPFQYTYIGVRVSDNMTFTAVKNGKWGVINRRNEAIVPFDYSVIIFDLNEKNGSGSAYTNNASFSFLSDGKFVDKQYSRAQEIKNGYILVTSKKKEGLLNRKYEQVLPCEYENVNQLENNPDYFVVEKGGLQGLYDVLSQRLVIPIKYPYVTEANGNLLNVTLEDEQEAFFDMRGAQVFGKTFDAMMFPEPWVKSKTILAAVKKNGKWGLIDIAGKMVFPFSIIADEEQPDIDFNWRENFLAVETETGFGEVDYSGKIIIPFEYYSADREHPKVFPFGTNNNNQYECVRNSRTGETGVIDMKGNWVYKCSGKEYIDGTITTDRLLKRNYVVIKTSEGASRVREIETGREFTPLPEKPKDVVGINVSSSFENQPLLIEVDNFTSKEFDGIYLPETKKLYLSSRHRYISYNRWEKTFTACIADNEKSDFFSLVGKYALVDESNKNVTSFEYDELRYDRNGRLFYARKGSKIGFIDKYGKEILPLIYDTALLFRWPNGLSKHMTLDTEFRNGHVSMRKGNLKILMNKSGATIADNTDFGDPYVTELYYEAIGRFYSPMSSKPVVDFSNGKIAHHKKLFYKKEVYDKFGGSFDWMQMKKIGDDEEQYDPYFYLRDGMLCLRKNGKFGFLDYAGNEAIPFIYDEATSFIEGLATVKKDGEYFIINRSGERMNMKHAPSMVFNIRKQQGVKGF